jgi:hypothetical protein
MHTLLVELKHAVVYFATGMFPLGVRAVLGPDAPKVDADGLPQLTANFQ